MCLSRGSRGGGREGGLINSLRFSQEETWSHSWHISSSSCHAACKTIPSEEGAGSGPRGGAGGRRRGWGGPPKTHPDPPAHTTDPERGKHQHGQLGAHGGSAFGCRPQSEVESGKFRLGLAASVRISCLPRILEQLAHKCHTEGNAEPTAAQPQQPSLEIPDPGGEAPAGGREGSARQRCCSRKDVEPAPHCCFQSPITASRVPLLPPQSHYCIQSPITETRIPLPPPESHCCTQNPTAVTRIPLLHPQSYCCLQNPITVSSTPLLPPEPHCCP